MNISKKITEKNEIINFLKESFHLIDSLYEFFNLECLMLLTILS